MKYLLDTNTCIACIRRNPVRVYERMTAEDPGDVSTCSPAVSELRYGAGRSTDPAYENDRIDELLSEVGTLPFDDDAANEYVRIRLGLEAAGFPIGTFDTMIAAVARANDLTLVTHNTKDFARVPGLRIEDWQVP